MSREPTRGVRANGFADRPIAKNTDGYGSARSMRCGRRREYTPTPSKLASRRLTVPMLCSTHRNSGEPAWTSHGRYLDSM